MPFRIIDLSSTRNPLLQDVKQSGARGRLTEDGFLVIEGPHLVDEAIRARWPVERLFFTHETFGEWETRARECDAETYLLPVRTFRSIATTESTQSVMALVRPRSWNWDQLFHSPALVVALDGIQDPGNAGTIIRAAEAFGATGVVLLQNSVKLSNSKLLRASAGSVFRMPTRQGVGAEELIHTARQHNLQVVALHGHSRATLESVPLEKPSVLVVGSEGKGISDELLQVARQVRIPTRGVESLNAAVACAVALYEVGRRRGLLDEPV